MRIGYLGPAGTHTQSAIEAFCAQYPLDQGPITWVPMTHLTRILEAVEAADLDLACVPLENALEGSVSEVLDTLAMTLTRTRIVAEFVRPVQHSLIRRYPFCEGIRFVHSHPQALAQTREALKALLGSDFTVVSAASTAEAVRGLLQQDETHAAIGTPTAARHFGLDVVVESLGDLPQNATLFCLLSATRTPRQILPEAVLASKPFKTSLCVGQLEDVPGSLLKLLTPLARLGLNMSKIESRPNKQGLGQYVFYIDIEGTLPTVAEATLRDYAAFFRILGVYPSLGCLVSSETSRSHPA